MTSVANVIKRRIDRAAVHDDQSFNHDKESR